MPDPVSVSSTWTIDTAMQLLASQRADDKEALFAALIAMEKAVTKAEVATEKRFDGVNEFRQSLADQAKIAKEREADFMTRREYAAQHEAMILQISELAKRLDRNDGRRDGVGLSASTLFSIISAVGVVIAIAFGILNYTHAAPVAPIYVAPAAYQGASLPQQTTTITSPSPQHTMTQ